MYFLRPTSLEFHFWKRKISFWKREISFLEKEDLIFGKGRSHFRKCWSLGWKWDFFAPFQLWKQHFQKWDLPFPKMRSTFPEMRSSFSKNEIYLSKNEIYLFQKWDLPFQKWNFKNVGRRNTYIWWKKLEFQFFWSSHSSLYSFAKFKK